jgi:hypothetical protein
VDETAMSVVVAGFPYGEPLRVEALAQVGRAPKQAQAAALATSTRSPASVSP